MYRQILDPVAGSLAWSSLVAAIPLLALFVLLGILRMTAWLAALISLAVALVVAIVVYPMPAAPAFLAAAEGAAFGFFPILWIVLNAIWIYNMTVHTGHFDVLRRSFAKVSDDQRIQGVIIAFSFGALLEALAGFGTPVAITSVMLIALGFKPLKAATVALVANTAPVAFGALAVPITTLATVTNLPLHDLSAMVGRQTPVLGVFVPLALVFIIDGKRGIRQTWPGALVCGVVFAVAQFAVSNYVSAPLTDIIASLLSAGAMVLFLRVWTPAESYVEGGGVPVTGAAAVAGGSDRQAGASTATMEQPPRNPGGGGSDRGEYDRPAEVFRAYAPYLIIIAVFALAQIPALKDALTSVTKTFNWPGLHIQSAAGKASTLPQFKLDWLDAAGTLLVIAGLLTIPVIRIRPARALRAYGATYRQLATAIVTVMAVLALAYVMNASGQTATLGTWMAGAGGAFALISPILGWLGVAVTGSDTSSNSLFGALQVVAAQKAGLSATLLSAANSSGGVLGKMISPQNLAIAAAAVGMSGKEGDLFRRVLVWSLVFVAVMCLLVYLQSTSALAWMVP
ncbi:L-lactate permease [Amycolatopsis acidiphila]|uniref:L-lactate permease n=1 Tax=Amycolatopsis acidiphila TaxID=715473 RepID=A0A558ACJ3_9PSEU|nr:L-lactate permease [Amycolatopsis acidiphila]TVT21913.1 L-lactate permease [Amycolatopsis acidiphila]UIJ57334.1 L-lactate permease [Amycolatopsis acidiphila]GHG84747.1 L-lactate permease [Amycolatopsis acidiphila]